MMIITCFIFTIVLMLLTFFYVVVAIDEERWMRSNDPEHDSCSPRLTKMARFISILIAIGFFIICTCVYDIANSKGYEKGQEDYINGVIKYKIVPTSSYTVERIKETK